MKLTNSGKSNKNDLKKIGEIFGWLLKGKIKFDQRPKISKSCSGQLNSGRLDDDEIKTHF